VRFVALCRAVRGVTPRTSVSCLISTWAHSAQTISRGWKKRRHRNASKFRARLTRANAQRVKKCPGDKTSWPTNSCNRPGARKAGARDTIYQNTL